MRRRLMALRLPLLLALLAAHCPLAFAQNLSLTLSAQPARPGVISTRQNDELTLLASSGNTLRFSRAEGRDQRLVAGGGWFWTQVEDVPLNAESLILTPTLIEDDSVEVSLEVARKDGTRLQRFSTTVIAQPGEWTQLYGPADMGPRGRKTYGTRSVSGDALFLRVEPR